LAAALMASIALRRHLRV
ncbi:hypothetical protein, partial [Frankia sp. CpI1-P]